MPSTTRSINNKAITIGEIATLESAMTSPYSIIGWPVKRASSAASVSIERFEEMISGQRRPFQLEMKYKRAKASAPGRQGAPSRFDRCAGLLLPPRAPRP